MGLSRDQILGADDLPRIEVEIPEWGGSVLVGRLTAGERDRLEFAIGEARERKGDIRAAVCAACLCDDSGARLFTPKDVAALAGKSGTALDRIYDAALDHNRMRKEDVDKAEGESAAGR